MLPNVNFLLEMADKSKDAFVLEKGDLGSKGLKSMIPTAILQSNMIKYHCGLKGLNQPGHELLAMNGRHAWGLQRGRLAWILHY